jgi:hypothetical protein
MAETHSHTVPGGRAFWLTEKLWRAAEGLPVSRVPLGAIVEFEQDCWRWPSTRAASRTPISPTRSSCRPTGG